ncbi:hypothetical protein, partial [Cesiribacter sp. SM1]|uniref:hypothetical protein n=1 Tax=Cesiribacter sp. SM1 TaxID=2861196 RepID=UPI001CD6CBD7
DTFLTCLKNTGVHFARNKVFTFDGTLCPVSPEYYVHFGAEYPYPYFALSFYNLVPSCYVCNANLKGQKDFRPSTHIHPFVEGIEDTLHFKINIDKVDFLLGKRDFDISLEETISADSTKATRAKDSSEIFHILEQYAFHKVFAGEIILKAYVYTDTKIEELLLEYAPHGSPIFSSREEIKAMLFGDYLNENELHNRVLSKLTRNLTENIWKDI